MPIGFDIGTAHCRVASVGAQGAVLLTLPGGGTELDSVVTFAGGRVLVGAAPPGVSGDDAAIRGPKSLLGGPPVRVAGGSRDPAEVVAHLLSFLVEVASAHLGRRPARGVLTAPPWFDVARLRSLEQAADLAGLGVEACILDTTAVALTVLARAPGVRRLGVVDAGASGLGVGLYRVVERRLVLEGVAGDRVHGDDPERLREACEGCAWIALDQAGRGPFDALVLSGGRARAPELRAAVEAAFGQRATGGFAALGAAALGAAILAHARAQGGRSVTVDESAYEPVVATVRSLPPDGSAASRPAVGGPATSPPRDAAERRAYAVAPPAPSAPPDAENLTRAPAWRAPQVASAPVIIAERPTSAAHPAAPVIVAVGGGAGASCSAPLGGSPTGAPGAPGVPLPTSIGSGTAYNPGTVEELIKLPLDRALTRADLDHLWLPVLLCRVVARRGITGTLTLESGSSSATLAVVSGQPHLRTPEHAALPRAFLWEKVAYSFDPRPPDERGRTATSMAKVAIEGLRARGRTFSVAELEQGIGPRLELAPVLRADRRGLVGKLGLDRREHRLVEEMDGFCTARELGAGGLGHHTTLQLCVILTAFGFVEWRAPARRAATSIHQQLEQRALRMEAANHFDALGVHWSASVADAELALASLHHELGPGTRANAEHPEACQRMIARAERAVAALREPAKLREYRRSLHPDIDFEALDDLMAKRIEALEMKHDEREADESRRAREVIAAVSMRPLRPSLPGPGRSR